MSGHSQFKNIMYRKGAQDAKKARVFAKLARVFNIALGGGKGGMSGGIKAGRQTGSYHLSFAGRPNGEKHHEDRQCRRKSGNRLLRQSANAFPPCQQ